MTRAGLGWNVACLPGLDVIGRGEDGRDVTHGSTEEPKNQGFVLCLSEL